MKLPFVQEVRRFEKRLLVWDGDPNQVPTKGREFIWVDPTARWRIADAKKFLENVASEKAGSIGSALMILKYFLMNSWNATG